MDKSFYVNLIEENPKWRELIINLLLYFDL